MGGPPVAIVRSQPDINACATGILGRSTHCSKSAGAPSAVNAARMMRTVSNVVFLLEGCGAKITASRHFTA